MTQTFIESWRKSGSVFVARAAILSMNSSRHVTAVDGKAKHMTTEQNGTGVGSSLDLRVGETDTPFNQMPAVDNTFNIDMKKSQ